MSRYVVEFQRTSDRSCVAMFFPQILFLPKLLWVVASSQAYVGAAVREIFVNFFPLKSIWVVANSPASHFLYAPNFPQFFVH
jgi:hypothetical protein